MPDKPPFSFVRLDHVVLRTAQIDKLLEFYTALGGEVVRVVESFGLHQLRAGESIIDLIDVTQSGADGPTDTGRNLDHFCMRIEPFDPDALREFLPTLTDEIREAKSVFGAEGYGPSFYIADPDGNTVELKGPSAP